MIIYHGVVKLVDPKEEIDMGSNVDDAAKVRDREVVLWDNTVTHLSRFWNDGPLVLVFLRHFG